MKKLSLALLILIISILLTGCAQGGTLGPGDGILPGEENNAPQVPEGDGNGESEEEKNENFINNDITFDQGETVMIVVSSDYADKVVSAQTLATNVTGKSAITVSDKNPAYPNEIVIGRCNREISEYAYSCLEGKMRENIYISRFCIYSTGNSIAIAFDDVRGYTQHILDTAVAYIEKNYVKSNESFNMPSGELHIDTIDLMAYQKEIDSAKENDAWAAFRKVAGDEAMSVLMRKYNEIYSDMLVDWFANLYDTELGGFYYSNSARDYEQTTFNYQQYDLAPDIESTAQALGFLESSGILQEFGSIREALPEWMQESIVKYIKSCQDPNGYFYHPQWTKAMVDAQLARRGRDLTSALGILRRFGAAPTYDALETKGDGLSADGTPVSEVALTYPISISSAAAVSYIVALSSDVPAHLKDEASFRAYLAQFEKESNSKYILRDSYWIGNQLAAQAAQISNRDKQLAAAGESYTLSSILGEWLEDFCQEETGTWSLNYNTDTGEWAKNTIYDALNGLMKISSACESLGIALPYPEASVETAIATITTTDYNGTVCYAYNSWFAINNILSNVSTHEKDSKKAEQIITNIRTRLRENAPELIEATLNKQSIFLCEDGSFSYNETHTSTTSQGLPVAYRDPITSSNGLKEGDVNATVICTTGTLGHMFDALGYPDVPILYGSDFNEFMMIIEANRK